MRARFSAGRARWNRRDSVPHGRAKAPGTTRFLLQMRRSLWPLSRARSRCTARGATSDKKPINVQQIRCRYHFAVYSWRVAGHAGRHRPASSKLGVEGTNSREIFYATGFFDAVLLASALARRRRGRSAWNWTGWLRFRRFRRSRTLRRCSTPGCSRTRWCRWATRRSRSTTIRRWGLSGNERLTCGN